MKRILSQKLHLISLLGSKVSLSVAELVRVLVDPRALVFLALVLVAIGASDPFDVHQLVSFWQIAVFWPIAMLMYLAICSLVLTGFAAVSLWFPGMLTPVPLKSAIAMGPAVILGESFAYFLTTGAHVFDIPGRILFFFLLVQVFETLFYTFVVPQTHTYRRIVAAQKTQKTAPAARHIVVGAEKVPVTSVRHIEAREHHVCVTLDGTQITQRARLSDLVAQTRPEDGVQPHRSWWVSRQAAPALQRSGGRHMLKLADETMVPVARTRLQEVQDWVERHTPAATGES
ncbi:LytTR family DNA-binding domain-containing protein [Thalassococcus sp. BH17M4-6]|uniref:LytTR family DNA-binding domain-containing protein n=1 Tax=Thalassococcus sp. BH17M4-6 TaxID=3413148 RepID=UPI003BC74D73